jgi:hypothetical protein
MKNCFELFYDGYTPADIVRNLEMSETDVLDLEIKINKWLDELKLESCMRDSYLRYK